MALYESLKTDQNYIGEVIDVSDDQLVLRTAQVKSHAAWEPDASSRYILIDTNRVSLFFELTNSGRIPQFVLTRLQSGKDVVKKTKSVW